MNLSFQEVISIYDLNNKARSNTDIEEVPNKLRLDIIIDMRDSKQKTEMYSYILL